MDSGRPVMPTLLIDLGGGEIRELSFQGERITIGRRPGCQVHLPHASVSAEHAAIVAERGGCAIEDLASRNGTLVNGKRVVRRRLHDRDLIEIGVHRIVFTEMEEARPGERTALAPEQGVPEAEGEQGSIRQPADAATASTASPSGEGPTSSPPSQESVQSAVQAVDPALLDASLASDHKPASVLPAIPPRSLVKLTGDDAGAETRLSRRMTSIGRNGAVVAWVVHREGEFLLVAAKDHPLPVAVDGKAVESGPVKLRPGRRLSLAGADFYFREDRSRPDEAEFDG